MSLPIRTNELARLSPLFPIRTKLLARFSASSYVGINSSSWGSSNDLPIRTKELTLFCGLGQCGQSY